jgi:hypothetical protein
MPAQRLTFPDVWVDTSTVSGDGTIGNPARVNNSGIGGGYKGQWSAASTPYLAGALVKRGPWLCGATADTSNDPVTVEGNLGSAADWTPRGNAVQSFSALTLITANAQNSMGVRLNSVHSDWRQRRLIVDVNLGPVGGADAFQFGIYDSSLTTTPAPANGMAIAGCYGVEIDFFNNNFKTILNGVRGNNIGFGTVNPALGDAPDTNTWHRWYLDINDGGGGFWAATLFRDTLNRTQSAGNSQEESNPGQLAAWSIAGAAPAFNSWRPVVGAFSGGLAGLVRVKYAFTRRTSGSGWDLLSEQPAGWYRDWSHGLL